VGLHPHQGRASVIGILAPEEIEEMLMRNRFGRLAVCSESRPYIVPISYGYDGQVVFGFSGPGRKLDMMRSEPQVALLVDEITSPAQWRSVIVEGVFEELQSPEERKQGIVAITQNGPHLVSRCLSAESGLVIYRIRPKAKSGRFERIDA
jgi:nitroimidazol reductase NimA-like FMN-containing flavoprotein (pyridoxamine 5'-phosphate oxidase superfamily)